MILYLESRIDSKKKLIFFLISIFGIGLFSSKNICKNLGFDIETRILEINDEDIDKINGIVHIKYKYSVDAELKKFVYDNIQNLKIIKCYKGIRHYYKLPVNGQRTHTNGKTAKIRNLN